MLMTRYRGIGMLLLSALLLTGCKSPNVYPSLPAPPSFSEIGKDDLQIKMEKALEGAKGIRKEWLDTYAAEAELYRREASSCQAFVKMERQP